MEGKAQLCRGQKLQSPTGHRLTVAPFASCRPLRWSWTQGTSVPACGFLLAPGLWLR